MDLIEIADVREWLSQFSEADIPIAISMLRSLNLVSHNAFSAGIENSIKTIVKKHGKAAVFQLNVRWLRKCLEKTIGIFIRVQMRLVTYSQTLKEVCLGAFL